MNPRDAIVMALTPGSPFNAKGLVFRSALSLCAFTDLSLGEITDLLAGDLAPMVTCKPSKKGKGFLVALREVEAQAEAAQQQLVAVGGPAFVAPLQGGVIIPPPEPLVIQVDVAEEMEEAFEAEDEF